MQRMRERVDWLLERLLVLLMASLVLDVVWQVFSRYALRAPSSFTDELARFLFIWIALLGASWMVGQRGHLAIDLLPAYLSPARRRVLSQFIHTCAGLFALLVLGWGGGALVRLSFALGQHSPVLGIPLGAVYTVVPFAGVLVMFYTVCNVTGALKEPTQ